MSFLKNKVVDKLAGFLSPEFSADNYNYEHEHDTSAEFSADKHDDAEFLPSARGVRGSGQAAAGEEVRHCVRGASPHLHHQSGQPQQLTAQRHGAAGRLTSTVVKSSVSASRRIVIRCACAG